MANEFIVHKGLIAHGVSHISGTLFVTDEINSATFSGSFIGNGSQIHGIENSISSSYVDYDNIGSKPTLVSHSAQISYLGLSEIPSGIVSGSSQITYSDLTGVPSGIVSGSSQVTYSNLTGIPSGIVSGSSQVSYTGLSNTPSGIVSGSAQIADFGIFAATGSNTFQGSQTITGSLFVSQNLIVAGSSSIQYISSSIVDIADNIITVNAFNPGTRFGGLAVADSGSTPRVSGSLLFDSIKDQWVFVHETPTAVTSSILLMGPETYNDLGNETYISANRLPKGSGIEHLRDSNITDTGTRVSINSNTEITGSLIVTTSGTINGVTITTNTASQTLTNKTIAAGSNTITGLTNSNLSGTAGITNANLANSTISGIALGSNLATLTIGTGLSGTSYNGSTGITIANTGVTSISAGSGISVNASTGAVTISNTITNNNQLTNGAGYIAQSTADGRYLMGTTSPSTVNNFTISIGNNGSYSYVQSHSGQPLELNPIGNTVRIAGNIVLHAGNYNSYSPTLTGGGASGTWGISINGSSASSTDALRIRFNDGPRNLSDRLPNTLARSVNWDFVGSGTVGGTGNYAGVMSFTPWDGTSSSTGDSSYQLAFMNETGINGSGLPGLRIRKGIDTTWGSWYTLLHAGNYNSYSPTLTGGGASGTWGISISGNAATASNSTQWGGYNLPTWTNWSSRGSIDIVVGQLGWKNYGNNHVIFDASNSTSPNGVSVNNTNSQVAWTGSYPTLMGWNGSNTYGVRVDSARISDNTSGNSATTSQTNFSSLTVNSNTVLHAGNYTSYTVPIGGSWYGSGLPGSRWYGYAVSGGEIVFGNGLPNAGQLGILIDGCYVAGENNGFWSLPSDNTWGGRRGMFWDGSQLNFTTNSPNSVFADISIVGSSNKYLYINPGNGYEAMVRYNGGSGSGWYAGKRTSAGINSTADFHFYSEAAGADVFGITTGGIAIASGDMRAPVFYDSNNTGYYVDGDSTSRMNYVVPNRIKLVNNVNYEPRWDFSAYVVEAQHWYGNNSSMTMYIGESNPVDVRGYMFNSSGNFRIADILAVDTDVRTQIFYDSNNTGYYSDPDSRTNINTLTVNGGTNYFYGITYFETNNGGYSGDTNSAKLQAYSSSNNSAFMSFHKGGHYAVNFGLDADNVMRIGGWSAATNRWQLDMSGNNWVAGSFRAPIFYDSDNTAYYLNPNGGSYLASSIEIANGYFLSNGVGGTIWMSSAQGSFGGYMRFGQHAVFESINGGYNFYVLDASGVGVVKTSGSQSWAAHSDSRIKTIHSVMENNLSKLESISPIYYSFNYFEDNRNRIGLIAQEVQEHFPELVATDPKTDYLTLDYTGLIPVLLGAIKELKNEIETLKTQL